MEFTKMTGNGNDFIILDDRKGELIGKEKKLAQKLCNRHFSIGADGILFVRESNTNAQIQMVIINADGSYASMCGNGIRCFAKYVWEKAIVKENVLDILDHAYINEIIKQPTAENIAVWIWDKLYTKLKRDNCSLYEIEVWETETSGVVYSG